MESLHITVKGRDTMVHTDRILPPNYTEHEELYYSIGLTLHALNAQLHTLKHIAKQTGNPRVRKAYNSFVQSSLDVIHSAVR